VHYYMAMFGGPVRVAPYATYGTDELARNAVQALHERTGPGQVSLDLGVAREVELPAQHPQLHLRHPREPTARLRPTPSARA